MEGECGKSTGVGSHESWASLYSPFFCCLVCGVIGKCLGICVSIRFDEIVFKGCNQCLDLPVFKL